MKGNQRRRSILALASVVLIVILALIQVRQYQDDRLLRDRIEQSHTLEAELQRVLSSHQDIETGQRGFVLTGKREFLQPYVDGRSAVARSLEVLRRSSGGNRLLQSNLDPLDQLTKQKLAFSDSVVALRERGEADAAISLISAGQGKGIMDEVRSRVGTLIETERRHLAELNADAAATRARVQLASLTLQLLLAAMLGAAFIAYLANVRRVNAARTEAADQSARQSAIFDAALDAMLVLDDNGMIEGMNPAAERMFGRTDLPGQPIGAVFATQPRDSTIRALLQRVGGSGRSASSTLQHFVGRRYDGTTFEADVAVSPVELADGRRFLIAIRDATERRRIERLKTEFVSTVSHELRTPLTSIAGSLGLVTAGAAGALEPRAQRLISIAHSNSQRLVRLINDILDIEKIESGKMVFDLRGIALRPLVEETINANLGFASQANVEVNLTDGGQDAVVRADHDRLIQVITNLLSNAIKFSPEGDTVEVAITPGTGWHRISISDKGSGIPEDFRGGIFGKFAQADSSDTRSKGGTGLGLAIVKEILDQTGGRIDYDTSPAGTTFYIDLPAVRFETSARTVLLVQVDDELSGEIRRSLKQQGIEVAVVRNREELGEAAGKRPYGAVLVGLEDKGEDGSSLVRLIRSHPALARLPILASVPGAGGGGVSQTLALVDWLDRAPSADDIQRGADLVGPAERGSEILNVLHVEDDEDVLRVVTEAFGSKARITMSRNVAEARDVLAAATPDLVILDLALPDESGLELLPDLCRPDGTPIPVVIYTASDEDPDTASRVAAMLTKSRVELPDLVATVLRVVKEEV